MTKKGIVTELRHCDRCGITKTLRFVGTRPRGYICRDCHSVLSPAERDHWTT